MTSQSTIERLNRSSNDILDATSFLFGSNAAYVEALYAQYLENPESVDPSWAVYFAELGQAALTPAQTGRGPAWARTSSMCSGWATLRAVCSLSPVNMTIFNPI